MRGTPKLISKADLSQRDPRMIDRSVADCKWDCIAHVHIFAYDIRNRDYNSMTECSPSRYRGTSFSTVSTKEQNEPPVSIIVMPSSKNRTRSPLHDREQSQLGKA
jgi:hypothetical protein